MDDDHYLSQDETDSKNYQEQYFEDMIDDMKFSDEEDDEEEGWNKIKGTTTFKPPRQETNGKKKIVQKSIIEIDKQFPSETIVKSGLSPGDLVITEGVNSVIVGDEVKIITK